MPTFRESMLEAIKGGEEAAPEIDLPEFDDDVQEPADPPAQEETSPAPTQPETQPEKTESPSLPPPVVDDSWRKDIESKLDASNNQMQMLLSRLVDRVAPDKQEEIPTGTAGGEDPYFVTKHDLLGVLKPIADELKGSKQEVFALREDRVTEEFYRAEKVGKEKFGEAFDKYVNPALRQKALDNAKAEAKAGKIKTVDWSGLFEQEYRANHYPDLARADEDRRNKEVLQAKQQEELKKVTAMPKGTTAHQAPVAPQQKQGASMQSRMESFRDGVKSAWKRFSE